MPMIVRPENYGTWFSDKCQSVLARPDCGPLEKFRSSRNYFNHA
jgi:hypothetical protein